MKHLIGTGKRLAAAFLAALLVFASGCAQGGAEISSAADSSAASASVSSQAPAESDISSEESGQDDSSDTSDMQEASSERETVPSSQNTAQSQAAASSSATSSKASSAQPAASSAAQSSPQKEESSSQPASSAASVSSAGQKSEITVHIVVECKTAVSYGNAIASDSRIAKDGVMCDETLTLKSGATVYDALIAAKSLTTGTQLIVNATQGTFGAYISSIQALAEKACGSKSGWIYFVNGTSQSAACSSIKLNDGDKIEWRYTCDSGNDLT